MNPQDHKKVPAVGPRLVPVRFEFADAAAAQVYIAGTFNEWKPTSNSMVSSGGGHWHESAVLAPGVYEYCLVVDGKWMADPLAADYVPNAFGGRNSVFEVLALPHAVQPEKQTILFPKNTTKPKSKNV